MHRLRALRAARQRQNHPQRQRQQTGQGFKLEVESLVARDISYVTEEYVPQRIEESKLWLD